MIVMFVITRSIVSVLLTDACKVAFDPTFTLPKFKFGGVIPKLCPNAGLKYRREKMKIKNSLRIA